MTDFETWFSDGYGVNVFKLYLRNKDGNIDTYPQIHKAMMTECIELPNKDVLIGFKSVDEGQLFAPEIIEYYKLSEIHLEDITKWIEKEKSKESEEE